MPQKKPTGPVKLDFSFLTANPPVARNSQFSRAYPTRALVVLTDEGVEDNVAVPIGAPLKLLESQLEQLGNAGCLEIFSVVTRLDRLARSTIDLLTTIKQIADKGCLFKSLAEPWADTTTPAGRLMLTVLGGLAEFERELIKIRTSEGRERAKRAGVKMGRKPILSAHQIAEIRSRNQTESQFASWLDPIAFRQIQFRE